MPGCYDALSARLVAEAGYKVMFMSGFAIWATRLALPDTGLVSFSEMTDSLRNCCSGAGEIPLIGDGDTGFGNALNVQRTVVEYARAGAAGVMIEDQISPKKCGHTHGKRVVSRAEARMKVRAAVDAKADADILIMARTDARAVLGFDEALERCKEFESEGADIIFLEAPESEDEMWRFCEAMKSPCMANMVPGGRDSCAAASDTAASRLQARPLSVDVAVVSNLRNASCAGSSPAGIHICATTSNLIQRSSEGGGLSRLLGTRDPLSSERAVGRLSDMAPRKRARSRRLALDLGVAMLTLELWLPVADRFGCIRSMREKLLFHKPHQDARQACSLTFSYKNTRSVCDLAIPPSIPNLFSGDRNLRINRVMTGGKIGGDSVSGSYNGCAFISCPATAPTFPKIESV